jgi:hypothetical protein
MMDAKPFGTAKQRDDLDWVFANGPEIISRLERETINALCECLLITCPTHDRDGGFIEYMMVGHYVGGLAKPFLMARDRAGWNKFCIAHLGLEHIMGKYVSKKVRKPRQITACVKSNNRPAWLRGRK